MTCRRRSQHSVISAHLIESVSRDKRTDKDVVIYLGRLTWAENFILAIVGLNLQLY